MPTDINTITAWCVVISTIITALTGFFIVQTFQLQAKVAFEQSKITKLEEERRLLEKVPVFKIARIEKPLPPEDFPEYLHLKRFEIQLYRGDIEKYQARIDLPHEDAKKHLRNFDYKKSLPGGIIQGSTLILDYTIDDDDFKMLTHENASVDTLALDLIITYENVIGNKFQQIISVPYYGDGVSYAPKKIG